MRIKTQRNVLMAASGVSLLAGFGTVADAFLSPVRLPEREVASPGIRVFSTIEPPAGEMMAAASKVRLQRPWIDAVTAPNPIAKVAVSPAVRWPNVQLDCVLFGVKSRIAVFRSGGQLVSCREGEEVFGITIEKILQDEVRVSSGDEKREYKIE